MRKKELEKGEKNMGWTSYHASHYKNGKVDRKAECDAYFLEGLNTRWYRIVKSTLVGSVYYAAVETLKKFGAKQPDGTLEVKDIPAEERRVWGAVFLTSVNSCDYYNFSYKDMSEDMGPGQADCPESILKLLSPTDNEWANEWRERCRQNAARKRSPDALKNLPVGAVIRYVRGDGNMVELLKHPPAYQFTRPFWYCKKSHTYVPTRRIPRGYEVVAQRAGD